MNIRKNCPVCDKKGVVQIKLEFYPCKDHTDIDVFKMLIKKKKGRPHNETV